MLGSGPFRNFPRTARRVNLIIDIQERIVKGKGPSYERWTKVYNIKQMARVKEPLKTSTELKTFMAVSAMLKEEAAGIQFVSGTGKRKSQAQRDWKEKQALLEQRKRYESKFSAMGERCSSYFKTNPDATFMRMKEGHMRNGQLKPGHNIEIAVNSEYIIGLEVFSDCTDVRPLRPTLDALSRRHQARYEDVAVDAD